MLFSCRCVSIVVLALFLFAMIEVPVRFARAAEGMHGTVVTLEHCGEVVEPGMTAYLMNDLDCRGTATEGVVLADRARLVLGGHTILGDPDERGAGGRLLQGVRCVAGSICTITGPGAVVGFSASGIAGTRVRVRDVYLADNAIAGVSAFENIRLKGVSFVENGALGVHAGGHVHADASDLTDQPGTAIVEWRAPAVRPGQCEDR